jgi:porin
VQVPISAFGGGVIALPREDILLSATVLDPSGTPDSNDIGEAFDDGVLIVGGGTFTVRPFGVVGHQSLNFAWNNKSRFSLDQDPANLTALLLQEQFPRLANPGPVLNAILTRFFPNLSVPAQLPKRHGSSWAMSYTFDQYLWQPAGNPHHGIGVFFGFGASDGNPNPIQYTFFGGIGGKGVVPGRPGDTFGIGAARTLFSDEFLSFLRQRLDLGLRREDAFEAYYNFALTPWLNTTLDLQIVNPGIKRALNASDQLVTVDTAIVLGGRVRVRF